MWAIAMTSGWFWGCCQPCDAGMGDMMSQNVCWLGAESAIGSRFGGTRFLAVNNAFYERT